MAKKVSTKQIKDAEVIEDTKITPTVEEQTEEISVEHEVKTTTEKQTQGKKKSWLPGFINEESVAKAQPIAKKVFKGVVYAATFYLGWKLKEALLGDNKEYHEDHESFDDEQELIDAEFTVVDSEE